VTGAALCLVGIIAGHDLTRIVGGVLAGWVVAAAVVVVRSGRGVFAVELPLTRIERGSIVPMAVRAENPTARATRPTTLSAPHALTPIAIPRVGAGRAESFDYEVVASRRGRVDFGSVVATYEDPLGLITRTYSAGPPAIALVYPVVRPVSVSLLGLGERDAGEATRRLRRRADLFYGLREYVVGDNVRAIHPRTSVRVGKPMCRDDVESTANQIQVLLDVTSDGDERAFEDCVDVAASIVDALLAAHVPVTLRTTAGGVLRVPPTSGGRESALRFLAEVARGDKTDAGTRARSGARTIVVTPTHARAWPFAALCVEVGGGPSVPSATPTIRVASALELTTAAT
jgi:uncharacterized protein (DUF58 family)